MNISSIIISLVVLLLIYIYKSCENLHIGNMILPFYKRSWNYPNIKNIDEINILCCSGMSNRIRTILGFLAVCNFYKKKLNVLWIKDNTCNGDFLNYFEPIINVNFVNDLKEIHYKGQSTIKNIISAYNIKCNISKLYSNIKLNKSIETKVQYYIKKNNIKEKIGLHIRRTDYTGNFIGKLINGSNDDDEFFNYINIHSQDKFFLAADNEVTQNIYKNKYGIYKIVYYKKIKKNNNLRKTSLEDAVIDIFILSYCKKIKGTYNSSFTEFAKYLKRSRNF